MPATLSATAEPSATSDQPFTREDLDHLPSWFAAGLLAAVVWMGAAGVSGVVLLWIGNYDARLCAAIATVVAAAAAWFRPRFSPVSPPTHAWAASALLIVVAFSTFNALFHSEHLYTDRDPAVYINNGRSIARTHELRPQLPVDPFRARSFNNAGAGFGVSGDRIVPNFMHFLPVVLALGWSSGGDQGLLVVPAILGGLGLLAIYALGTTLFGPRWAVLPVAILAATPLEWWFSRDAYSELAVRALAVSALWLLIEAHRRGALALAVIAGALMGATTFARIDAVVLLVGLPLLAAVVFWQSMRDDDFSRAEILRGGRVLAAFALSVAIFVALGDRAARALSGGYRATLGDEYSGLVAALAVTAVVTVFIVLAIVRWRHALHRAVHAPTLVGVMVSAYVIACAWAMFIRPEPSSARPRLPTTLYVPAEFRDAWNSWHYSYSLRWFVWYLGAVGVAFALAGVVVLMARAVNGSFAAAAVIVGVLPVALLYIARPSISADHYWAMRRYFPMVLPGFALAAAATAVWLTRAISSRAGRAATTCMGAMTVVLLVIPPIWYGAPMSHARMQAGALEDVHALCREVGDDAAVGIVPYSFLAIVLPQTVRSFCGVPAASFVDFEKAPPPLQQYAREWKALGRRFYVASVAREPVLAAAPNARFVAHFVTRDADDPERSLTSAPDTYEPRPVEIWLYEIPAA